MGVTPQVMAKPIIDGMAAYIKEHRMPVGSAPEYNHKGMPETWHLWLLEKVAFLLLGTGEKVLESLESRASELQSSDSPCQGSCLRWWA
jgi:hypothetical protein